MDPTNRGMGGTDRFPIRASRPPGSAEPARLIVWEPDGCWASCLRRHLAFDGYRMFETRTARACRQTIAESPASLVVARWSASSGAALLRLAADSARDFPALRIVAVGCPATSPPAWQALEPGFVWLCESPRRVSPVIHIIRRHFDQVPRPASTVEQRVWSSLPWQESSMENDGK